MVLCHDCDHFVDFVSFVLSLCKSYVEVVLMVSCIHVRIPTDQA